MHAPYIKPGTKIMVDGVLFTVLGSDYSDKRKWAGRRIQEAYVGVGSQYPAQKVYVDLDSGEPLETWPAFNTSVL